jgi:hypothetical protein
LKGNSDGEEIAVTVVKAVDQAKPKDSYMGPSQGNKFYAVQFRLNNTGTAAYGDSPSNGAKAIDTQGQQFDATFGDTAAGPSLPSDTNIAPKSSALGYITFEVPKTSKIVKVQFGLNSGFADQTGESTVG